MLSDPEASDLKRKSQGHPPASPASSSAVARQLDRILASETFVHAPQLCRFLRFIVEQEIAGQGGELKEYVLALQVFRKDESFDPRIDTVVRTEARRLRQKLAEYYQAEGRTDLIEIVLPKGSYRAVFQARPEPVSPPAAAPSKAARVPPIWIAAGVALAVSAALAWWFWIRLYAPVRTPSIAIIPLENLSADPEQEYFSDGMTDALFTDLAKIHGLSVISRTSVMRYKRTKKPVPEIARELKVDYVVEGTVTRSGDRVRITAQLITAPTDRHLWAESYERTGTDILSLQGELARAIAEQVHVHVTPQEQARRGSRPVSLEAQDLYLKGRFNWHTRDTGRLLKSIDYFQQAIAQAPGYALAYAGLSDSYGVLSGRSDRKTYISQACDAARKAIDLDPNLGEAYAGLATTCVDDWEWRERERQFRRALDLSPSYPTAHQWYGQLLIDMGRFKEGLAEMRRAVELDPLSPSPNGGYCLALYLARQYDKAIQHCRQTLDVFPDYIEPCYGLGFAYSAKGMYAQAIKTLEKPMGLSGGAPPVASLIAHARALAGDSNAVKRLLSEYAGRADVSPAILGMLYLDVGDKDQAFESLDRAVEQRSFGSELIKVHPLLDSLHSDPRWNRLLRHMNLAN